MHVSSVVFAQALTTGGDPMLLQDVGFLYLGHCEPGITRLAVLHPVINHLVLAKVM